MESQSQFPSFTRYLIRKRLSVEMWEILFDQDIWTACKTPKQWKGAHVGVIDQSCRSWVLSYVRSPLGSCLFLPDKSAWLLAMFVKRLYCYKDSPNEAYGMDVSRLSYGNVGHFSKSFKCATSFPGPPSREKPWERGCQMWYTPDWDKTQWVFPKLYIMSIAGPQSRDFSIQSPSALIIVQCTV